MALTKTPLAKSIGYSLHMWQRDYKGKLHRYRTSPSDGSGPTNYFDSMADLMRYIRNVEQIREWQNNP